MAALSRALCGSERADTSVFLFAPRTHGAAQPPSLGCRPCTGSTSARQIFGRESSAVGIVFAAHFGFSTGCFLLAQQTENHVAETMTPERHRELEHPDVFLQGSLPSGLFYGPAMNTPI